MILIFKSLQKNKVLRRVGKGFGHKIALLGIPPLNKKVISMSQSIFYFLFSILLGGVLIGIVLIMMNIFKFRRADRIVMDNFKREEQILREKIRARTKPENLKSPVPAKERQPIEQD